MNRNVGIAVAVGIAVIIGVIGFQISESSYQRTTSDEYYENSNYSDEKNVKHVVYPENPQILYGLTINKDKYLIGENVFFKLQGIPMGLKDSVQFFTPGGILYLDFEFDGNKKSSIKHYFRPALSLSVDFETEGLCDKYELIGKWTVIFASMPMEKIHFEITDEILPYSEPHYEGCNKDPFNVPLIQPSLGE